MLKSSIITRIKHFGLRDCRDPRFPIQSLIFHNEKGRGGAGVSISMATQTGRRNQDLGKNREVPVDILVSASCLVHIPSHLGISNGFFGGKTR